MNKKEKSDKIFNPHFKTDENFQKPEKQSFDKSDWGYRKYKNYNEFTKKFDKTSNN